MQLDVLRNRNKVTPSNVKYALTSELLSPTNEKNSLSISGQTMCVDGTNILTVIKDEVLLTVSSPIFPSILIAKNLLTGSLKNRSIDNLETQKKSIAMKNSQFFDYLLYAKSK